MKNLVFSFFVLLVALSVASCRKTETAPDGRSKLLGNWLVNYKFSHSKDGKVVAESEQKFFLNLLENGSGTRTFTHTKDTLFWGYGTDPESIVMMFVSGGYRYADRYIIKKNEADAQTWEINAKRAFYIDTAIVPTDYFEQWTMTRK